MTKKTSLTYADAGVDIDAGNALVETIKPLVRATRRRGRSARCLRQVRIVSAA